MTRHITTAILTAGLVLGGTMAALAADDAAPSIFEKKCRVCHSVAGNAGKLAKVGGPLDGVGKKRDEAWLRAYLANPKSKKPDGKMPNLKLAPADLDTLVAYLLTLK
jgi:cytochrome c2